MRDLSKKFFNISVHKYVDNKIFSVYRPSSLNYPTDNSVMFITKEHISKTSKLYEVANCLVFFPDDDKIPDELLHRHAIVPATDPKVSFCQFFIDNELRNLPENSDMYIINGAFISPKAVVGDNNTILPLSYIGPEVILGSNVYIGSGVRLIGEVTIGNDVTIRENTVVGADGLTTDRNDLGRAVTMPQFGDVVIEDDVEIGANVVIARGAIDHTTIRRGAKLDNSVFISHNVVVGEDTFIVGETILFGSVTIGARVLISGNATIRNGIHIGDSTVVGMGSVVVRDVEAGAIIKGNPAK